MLHAILDALIEPALLLDRGGRIAHANPAAQERLGVWVVGRSYVSVLRQPALLEPVEDAYAMGRAGQARFVHGTGEVDTPFDVQVSPLEGETGRQVLLVFRDTSELRAGESMRRDFVANVSHELKTPLTAISGFIETLQGPARDDPTARARFLGLMAQETARMNRLVGALLSLGRVEGQSRRRPTAVIDLVPAIRETLDMLRADTAGGADDMAIEVDLPSEAHAPADRDQIVQIVSNLIENGRKYSLRPGTLHVALRLVAHEPAIRGPAWRLSVRDEGPGIAPEHIPRLTERFYRVDPGRSRVQGGTGLGLAIVKHIVNRHRGRLRIESTPGQGTEVSIMLPQGPLATS